MVISLNRIVIWLAYYLNTLDAPSAAHRRGKRILGGRPLPSHNLYNTHFLVKLQQTFGCISDQSDHILADCSHQHKCGGALIRPDFVLTACHCVTYETYYAKGVWLPPYRRLIFEDLPKYIDDRLHYPPYNAYDPVIYEKKSTVNHPLLNSMTIFAGHVTPVYHAPQRRHAAKFFPHHLCAERENKAFPDRWAQAGKFFEMDIGLVKVCYPFRVNKDVKLAPFKPYDEIDSHFHRVVRQSLVCLLAGWGLSLTPEHQWSFMDELRGYGSQVPDTLQHMFSTPSCHSECYLDDHSCLICTTHHGYRVAVGASGDSGTPYICDGFVTAVLSRWRYTPLKNSSLNMMVAVACVKDYITDGHLAYLRASQNELFHWFNGRPVTVAPDYYDFK